MGETVKLRIDIESNGAKILKTLNLNVEDFNDLIGKAITQNKKFASSASKVAQSAIIFNSINTAVDHLQGLIGGLVDDYNAFDKSMRAVNTMAGENKKGFEGLTDQVEDLARVIPLAKTELANGLYQVISNGVPKDNWISFLEASAKSAVGGIADLGQTVTVTSTIIKNYGLEWDAATSIQDKIQMTAKNGVTSFEQLGQALPRVTGTAATLGVTIDELMATFATLAGVSGNTAEVSTQLAAVFTALVKPSSEASEMASQMGLKFDAASIKASGGMQQFLQTLTSTVEEYASTHGMLEQEIYGRLFGSAEALRALIPITGELRDTFSMNVESMAGSAGTIDRAFEEMSGSGEATMQMFKNSMSTIFSWAGGIASSIQPMLTFVAVSGQSIYSLKMLKEASMQALSGIKSLIPTKRALIVVTAKLNRTILRNPYIAIIAGVVALGSAIYALVSAESEAEKAAKQMAVASEHIQTTIDGEITKLKYLWQALETSTKGSKEWKTAKDAIVNQYGQYFTDLETEIEKVGNLSGLYDQLTKSVEKSIRARELSNYIKDNDPKQRSGEKMAALYRSLKEKGGEKFANRVMPKMRNAINAGNADVRSWGIGYKDMRYQLWGSDELETAIEMAREQKEFKKQLKEYMTANGIEDADLFNAVTGVKMPEPTDPTGQTPPTIKKDKAWYESEKKKAEEEFAALTEIDAQGRKGMDLKRKIASYQNKIDTIWGTGKKGTRGTSGVESRRNAVANAQEEYNEQMAETLASWDSQIADLNVASMEEGTDKEIAQIKRDTQRKRDALNEAINELVSKKKEQEKAIWLSANADKSAADWKPTKIDEEYRNEVLNENDYALLLKYWEVLAAIDEEESQRLKAYKVPGRIDELDTLSEVEEAIGYYEDKLKNASVTEVLGIQRTIEGLRRKEAALKRLMSLPGLELETAELGNMSGKQLKMELELIGLDGIKGKIRELQKMLNDTENPLGEERKGIEAQIKTWERYGGILLSNRSVVEDVSQGFGYVGQTMQSLSGVVEGSAAGWLQYGSNVLAAISQAIPAISAVVSANTAQAISGATAQSQTMPFPLNILALTTSLAAVGVALASVPKFADGGIAYGPTLGLFGEYAGAKSNPEVVAPLDRLRGLMGLQEPRSGGGGEVKFRIDGRALVGVLEKMERYNART